MSAAPDHSTATLVVEARDLDTDARSRESFTVAYPPGSHEQRDQLAGAAAKVHPNAEMRSFAGGAATFLDRQHLIVAFYADLPAEPTRSGGDRKDVQEPLFA